MNYIIKHDFKQIVPYYVKLVDDKEFQEIYNPKFATQFNTKNEAMKWIKESSSMSDHSKVIESADAIQEFEKWMNNGMLRRTLSCINKTMSRPYNNETVDEVIDWWIYQKHNDDEIKYEHYQTWPNLYNITNHLWDVEAYWNSNCTELFITFQIFTPKDGNFNDFEEELNQVIDKVTYKDDEGYLIFPVFDHYFCEHGDKVFLLIHPETKRIKIDGSYLWNKNWNEFDSLKDAFEYLKKERYYE